MTKSIITKTAAIIISTALTVVWLSGCSPTLENENTKSSVGEVSEKSEFYRFTDDSGHEVVLNDAPKRVACMMGSFAELWLLAGGEGELVGATEDAVSERGLKMAEGVSVIGSVKKPDIETLLSIKPDFIIMSTDVEAHLKLKPTLDEAKIKYAYFKEDSFEDYKRIMKICTGITGEESAYKLYCEEVGAAVDKAVDAALKAAQKQGAPTVLLIRSMSSKAKALKEDHMVGAMLKELGADNIATREPSLLEDLSMEKILLEDPDFILVVTMGQSDKALETLKNSVESHPAWSTLSAVKNDRYIVLEKELFQYKPNARWGESYQKLEEILYENK